MKVTYTADERLVFTPQMTEKALDRLPPYQKQLIERASSRLAKWLRSAARPSRNMVGPVAAREILAAVGRVILEACDGSAE